MDPSRALAGVDKYGMTPYEQRTREASPIGCRRKNLRCTRGGGRPRRRRRSPGADTALVAVLRLGTHLMLPDDLVERLSKRNVTAAAVDAVSRASSTNDCTNFPRADPTSTRDGPPLDGTFTSVLGLGCGLGTDLCRYGKTGISQPRKRITGIERSPRFASGGQRGHRRSVAGERSDVVGEPSPVQAGKPDGATVPADGAGPVVGGGDTLGVHAVLELQHVDVAVAGIRTPDPLTARQSRSPIDPIMPTPLLPGTR
jgi:hypothetical protein